ncbi:MAG: hypothetical protein AAF203_00390 [Pseudomonadota bacterium]
MNKQPAIEEYNLAQVAFRSAKENEAKRYAPNSFSQARRFMRRGEKAYRDRHFERSEKFFRKSRFFSEKSENISRVKMFTQGEMAP